MKTPLLLFFTVVFLLIIPACECGRTCSQTDRRFIVQFIYFGEDDVRPFIVKRYVRGTGFTVLRDSIYMNNLGPSYQLNGLPAFNLMEYDDDSTDFQYSLPSAGLIYRLSNTVLVTEKCQSCAKIYHIHSLGAYNLNGQSFTNADGQTGVIIQK